jgi:hypothetical protein
MDARTGIVQVAYHQYYLRDLGMVAEVPDEVFTGGNGLISTPPGIAVVHAGTHTGPVRVTVQARTDPPPHTDLEQWEEVVEVSITTQAGQVLVEEWGGPTRDDLGSLVSAGPGSYRLRMHARGRDQAHTDVVAPGDPIEEHLLITWPAPATDETIVKQTDRYGAHHRGASPGSA